MQKLIITLVSASLTFSGSQLDAAAKRPHPDVPAVDAAKMPRIEATDDVQRELETEAAGLKRQLVESAINKPDFPYHYAAAFDRSYSADPEFGVGAGAFARYYRRLPVLGHKILT